MKNISTVLIGVFAFFFFATTSNLTQNEGSLPHIKFATIEHDYGQMLQNGDGKYSFTFENTGKEPLIIQNVRSSCGCTVAKRPTEPILPGESASISVKYDTRRLGPFHKNITVTSNADNKTIVLKIKGDIKAKPTEEVPVKKVNEGFTPVAG